MGWVLCSGAVTVGDVSAVSFSGEDSADELGSGASFADGDSADELGSGASFADGDAVEELGSRSFFAGSGSTGCAGFSVTTAAVGWGGGTIGDETCPAGDAGSTNRVSCFRIEPSSFNTVTVQVPGRLAPMFLLECTRQRCAPTGNCRPSCSAPSRSQRRESLNNA